MCSSSFQPDIGPQDSKTCGLIQWEHAKGHEARRTRLRAAAIRAAQSNGIYGATVFTETVSRMNDELLIG
jgi:hypothetical protein